jgi:hypothetical protein
MKNSKITSVQIVPVQGMVAGNNEHDQWDVIAIRVTVYEDGFTAWYPVNAEHLAVESILDANQVDMYWDWIKFNDRYYGDWVNPFPDKVF